VGKRRTKEDDERERRALREAMERLLDGRPETSSGELNKSELAREAGLRRHSVANRHTDIGDEFMRRVAAKNHEPERVTRLRDDLGALREAHLARGAELREKDALIKRYADNLAVAVLSVRRLERRVEALERELASAPSSQPENVVTMSPRGR
jgi:hypothetical protein